MSVPQMFGFNGFDVRVVVRDGDPWFVAKDVCEILDISNPTQAIGRLDEDERAMFNIGRQGDANVINESGLYSLVLGSRKPEAKSFKKWITGIVIPSIRKNGAYMTPETIEKTLTDPDFIIKVATQLKAEQAARIAAENKLDEQRPLVAFAETCMDSDRNMLVREVAKLVSKNGILIGEHRLYKKLREWGMVCRDSTEPTQRGMELGLFEIVKGVKQTPKGAKDWSTTRVTPKGQAYIVNRLQREKGA